MKSQPLPIIGPLVLVGLLALLAAGARAGDPLVPVELRQVQVGGEMGRRIEITVKNNLLVLDIENDFLKPFRERNRTGGYIGLGKLIDAAVRFAAHTRDDRVLELKKRLVTEAVKTQEPDGYLGLFVPESRVWELWDIHEMAYLVCGLTADHEFFGKQSSLDAARKLADYIIARWSEHPEKIPGAGAITLHMAVTGIEPAMLALTRQTNDSRYADFCVDFRKLPEWHYPIVLGRWGPIGGHAYTYLCMCTAQLRLHRSQPLPQLLAPTRGLMEFLTAGDGLVITGGCGDHECWHDTQAGTTNLGETCSTAYLIRWLDEQLRLEGDPHYADIMERAIYNALFAAQSPDGRRIRYYSPFETGRAYWEGDTYCCPCNYRRIIAELPGMIYYRSEGGVAVSLYTASSADVENDDGLVVNIRQETDYPNSGKVLLRIDPSQPARFPLRLRIPRWCGSAAVTVNDRPVDRAMTAGTFLTLQRQWRAGDRVELQLPMSWRLVRGRKAQAGRVAIVRGPLLFCLNPASHEGLSDADLRLITIDPGSIEGPIPDNSVRPGGLACRVRGWGPGVWYPQAKTSLQLRLTEFPDPGGRATYFHVPNPRDDRFVDDELVTGAQLP